MNKEYESPRFDFQECQVLERVADTCWGYHYGWYDPDGDGPMESVKIDLQAAGNGSCKSVENGLVKYIQDTFHQTISGNDVKTNSQSTVVVAIPDES